MDASDHTGEITFSELTRRIRAFAPRAGSKTGRTSVVAVDGPSGSGKTTFASKLSARLGCPTVHMDDLYPGWDGLADSTARLISGVLKPLAANGLPRYRRFDWEAGEYAEWNTVPFSDWLIVEGVGSGALAAAEYLSYLIWIEAPGEVRMQRGIERDGESFRPHWERWAMQETRMFGESRTRERADLLVDGAPEMPHDPDREFILLEP